MSRSLFLSNLKPNAIPLYKAPMVRNPTLLSKVKFAKLGSIVQYVHCTLYICLLQFGQTRLLLRSHCAVCLSVCTQATSFKIALCSISVFLQVLRSYCAVHLSIAQTRLPTTDRIVQFVCLFAQTRLPTTDRIVQYICLFAQTRFLAGSWQSAIPSTNLSWRSWVLFP